MEKQDVEKLLGRSLSEKELQGFEEYLDIAHDELEELLNFQFEFPDSTESEEPASVRTFEPNNGFRSLYVDPFIGTPVVMIDEDIVDIDDYHLLQNDRRNSAWFNTIVFDHTMHCRKPIEVTATWGFGHTLPNDFQLLIARTFVLVASAAVSGKDRVRSKSIEDFSVTYDTKYGVKEQFLSDNARIIAKYRLPKGDISHGCI